MIINEKYLQDIDDEDDDDVLSDQPFSSRVIPSANTKFDHYVRIWYCNRLQIIFKNIKIVWNLEINK